MKVALFIAICIIEFILSQIPITITLGISAYELGTRHFKLQSTLSFIGYCCWYLDCVLTPFWVSWISLRNKAPKKPVQHLLSVPGTSDQCSQSNDKTSSF